jgi:hypothetical protein
MAGRKSLLRLAALPPSMAVGMPQLQEQIAA